MKYKISVGQKLTYTIKHQVVLVFWTFLMANFTLKLKGKYILH